MKRIVIQAPWMNFATRMMRTVRPVTKPPRPLMKALLRQRTDNAISRGVFGVPSMEVGDELFWGYDDFPYLDLFLAGNDPLDPVERQRWRLGSRPSSVRRQFRSKAD